MRVIVLAQLYDHPLLAPRGELDSGYYLALARQVADGDLLVGYRVFFVSPLYIYVLGALLAASGGSVLVAQAAQVALGAAAVGLVYATARRWFDERASRVAGLLALTTGYFAFNEALILQSALDAFLTALELYLLTRAWQEGGSRWPAAAGALLGLHALNRPNVLVFAAMAVVLTVVAAGLERQRSTKAPEGSSNRPGAKAPGAGEPEAQEAGPTQAFGWRPALAMVLGIALALLPAALRNAAIGGGLNPVPSHGGLNFYIGNNPEADGTYRAVPGITPSIAGQDRDMRQVAEAATGRALTDAEVSSYFYGLAWDWIAGHRGQAARLFARKVAYVFNATDLSLNFSYAYYSRDETTLLRWLAIGPWLLLPLGLLGLLVTPAGGRTVAWWAWLSFVPVYALSVAAFFVSGRYRLPLLVPLCVTGGAAAVALWDAARERRAAALASLVAMLALLGVATNWDFGLDDGRSGERTEMILHLVDSGRDAEARALLDATEPTHPQRDLLLYRVARAYLDRRDPSRAVPLLERAAAASPGRPEVALALGQALLDTGRPRDAVPHLRSARDAGYQPAVAGFDLSRALAASGQGEDAMAALVAIPSPEALDPASALAVGRLAVELGAAAWALPVLDRLTMDHAQNAAAHELRGLALQAAGRPDEAMAALETACRLDLASSSARLNLAVLYAEAGRIADARAQAEEALRLRPGYARAQAFLDALGRAR